MFSKIATINISLPYRGPGNIIRQNFVSFDIYSEEGQYIAIPALNKDERRIANLPEELVFKYQNGKTVSDRSGFDGNFHTIQDIVLEMQKQNLI